MNFVFVMLYLELIPRRRRLSRRLEIFIHKPGKRGGPGPVSRERERERERDGRKERLYLSKRFEIDSDCVLEYTVVCVK